ncbi:CDP-alcohol phosphatidyltransferase family protein [Blattabacterium cuenoti]|uniref:CDP-alcohol phosphatidyltransferase family protein n=1 Tax=Blattabacterium cuenoti TaxID=1653831 RepID=UPI00293BFE06|nr:CDP-alcohol phosphatidyltransferase family protein [Blattabacterium cuenoti]
MFIKIIRKNIPNIFTLLNLFFGCISIIILIQYKNFKFSFICTIFSLICDFLDGFFSRFMKIENKFGKELDSLADIISFGIVPSIIIFFLLKKINIKIPFVEWSSFLITIFSACRLANFNISKNRYTYGLNTPINTLFFTSLSVILFIPSTNYSTIFVKKIIFSYPMTILFIIFFSCYFLISKILMFSFIFNGYSWKKNKKRYVFLIISIFLLLTLQIVSLPCIIIFYLITSIYFDRFNNNRKNYIKKT